MIEELRAMATDPSVDVIIVHHANGDNSFFSHKPEIDACERARVIEACEAVIAGIRDVEARERARPGRAQYCPGSDPNARSRGGICPR